MEQAKIDFFTQMEKNAPKMSHRSQHEKNDQIEQIVVNNIPFKNIRSGSVQNHSLGNIMKIENKNLMMMAINASE
jgi:hypothetical protein